MIKEIIMAFSICLTSIILGFFISRLFKWEPNILTGYVWGITGMLALFHIVAYPLYILKASFSLLFFIYIIIILIFLVFSIISFYRNKDYKIIYRNIKEGFAFFTDIPLMIFVLLLLISALIYTCIFCYHPTIDDGYYLARSMEVISNNSLNIHPSQSWYGEIIHNYPDLTDASTLSFFISFLSQLFKLPPAIICRRGFAFLIICAHLASISIIFNVLSVNGKTAKEEKIFFLIAYILFQMVSEKVCSSGRWLTSYIWQGKAILMALIFPLILVSCANIISHLNNHELKKSEWLSIFTVLSAGISVSTVGLFLPLILFFSYGTAYLFFTRFQYFKKVIFHALLATLPVIVCGIISYLHIATENTRYFQIGKTAEWSWIQQFFRANDIFQFCLFILSCLYFAVKGSLIERILFCFAPVILFLTFLNPLFSGFVSTYVTTAEVYWRLYWLLPIYVVPALTLTKILAKLFNGGLQKCLLSISVAFALLIGFKSTTYYIVSPALAKESLKTSLKINSPKRENSYAVSEEAMAVANTILDDWNGDDRPRLLTKYDDFYEIRQCTNKIITYWAEQADQIPGFSLTIGEMINEYDQFSDMQYLYDVLKAAKVNYICLKNTDNVQVFNGEIFQYLLTAGEISIWKIV